MSRKLWNDKNILEVAMIKKNVLIGIAEHHYKTSARAPGRVLLSVGTAVEARSRCVDIEVTSPKTLFLSHLNSKFMFKIKGVSF